MSVDASSTSAPRTTHGTDLPACEWRSKVCRPSIQLLVLDTILARSVKGSHQHDEVHSEEVAEEGASSVPQAGHEVHQEDEHHGQRNVQGQICRRRRCESLLMD